MYAKWFECHSVREHKMQTPFHILLEFLLYMCSDVTIFIFYLGLLEVMIQTTGLKKEDKESNTEVPKNYINL